MIFINAIKQLRLSLKSIAKCTNDLWFSTRLINGNISHPPQLGNLPTGASKEVDLTVCPVKTGLITITDLVLTETFSKSEYKFEDFLQVFVVESFKDSELFEMDKNVKYVIS